MNSPKVLIIDDEVQIRKLLRITLESFDFKVREAATAKEGLHEVAGNPPDLILLDLGLPDKNGHEVLRHLREWYTRPIIILSVQSDESEIVLALDAGANDYLIKPFRTGELVARIRAALRHSTTDDGNPILSLGDLSIDFAARTLKREGAVVKLTSTEYALLALFAQNEGKVLTHQYLLNHVWGQAFNQESQYLRVYVAQLRKKIEKDPNRPEHIITESGVGYRFVGK